MMRALGRVGRFSIRRVDFLSILVAILVVTLWEKYTTYVENQRPASDWFTFNRITVPDFEQGSDPIVLYDRTVKQPFYGEGKSEVREVGANGGDVLCSGGWSRAYEPTDVLDPKKVTFQWILGATVTPSPCVLPPGQYVVWFSLRVRPLNGVTREVVATTDPFIVYPKGGQIFVTPEQVRKLEETQQ